MTGASTCRRVVPVNYLRRTYSGQSLTLRSWVGFEYAVRVARRLRGGGDVTNLSPFWEGVARK